MTLSSEPAALLADLVAISSVNPDLVPGAGGEATIAAACEIWFAERGFVVHRLEARPGRPSIVAIARGSGGGRSLMFNGHIDTVTLEGYDGDPLRPVPVAGEVHGRGAFDMKSGVAAMMVAADRAKRAGLRGDLLVALVADEEHASIGTAEVLTQFRADAAVVTEPSHLDITIAHKGFVWFDVVIHGVAAHGSRPDLGVDAIVKAGAFLVELGALGVRLRGGAAHPLLGTGSIHASLIRGGQELSSYPAECRISVERRTIAGETDAVVAGELRAILQRLAEDDPHFRFDLLLGLSRPPFEVGQSEPIVECLKGAATARLGAAPKWRGEPFWTDCALLAAAGIPAVLFGADGGGAHAAREWAVTASVEAVADILFATAVAFCGTTEQTGDQRA